MKKTICIDFDGVCNMYTGWQGENELFKPRPGIDTFLCKLIEADKRVAIFSTRPSDKLKTWFLRYFPGCKAYIENETLFFPDKKPPADCYIDDRAVKFTGDFNSVINEVLNFKAFWETKNERRTTYS